MVWYIQKFILCDNTIVHRIMITLVFLPFPQMSLIFGKNKSDNVAVVDASIKAVMVTKASVTFSAKKFANTTMMALVITTL